MISTALAVLENEEQRNELAEFYNENKNRFYAIAFSKLNNRTDAEDAVQETFLRIADKPEIFFSKGHNDRVLYTAVIIRNVSVDAYQKRQRHKCESLSEDIVDDSMSVMEKAIGKSSKDELMIFINSLTEALRQALFLKIHYQM